VVSNEEFDAEREIRPETWEDHENKRVERKDYHTIEAFRYELL
jgi:hypothetical protein